MTTLPASGEGTNDNVETQSLTPPPKMWHERFRLDALKEIAKDNLVFVILFLIIAIQSFALIYKVELEYDGSYNLQIPKNIAKGIGYYTDFPPDKHFDYRITTGYPALLPVAVMFKLFGVGVIQFRIITLFYYLAFVVMLYVVAKRISSKSMALLPVAVFWVFSNMPDHLHARFNLLGEIPGAFFALLGFYLLERALNARQNALLAYSALAGVALALAVETKTIFFFAIPAVAGIYFYDVFIKKHAKGVVSLATLLAVMVLMFGSWIAYKERSLGPVVYAEHKAQTKRYFKLIGTGVTDCGIIVTNAKMEAKLKSLAQGMGMSPKLTVVLAILIAVSLLARLYQDKITYIEIAIALFVASLLSWWLFVSEKDLFRHVMPALIIGLSLMASVCAVVCDRIKNDYLRLLDGLAVGFAAVAFFVALMIGWPSTMRDLPTQIEFANKVAALKDDIVYHGWWQNPEIVFLRGEPFLDLNEYLGRPNKMEYPIIIFSPTEKRLTPEKYAKLKTQCKEPLIVVGDYEACPLSTKNLSVKKP